jgi:hypothetical protein
MTDSISPPLDERDFDAIEAAVMETARGRWFLGEFAKRNRIAETRLLLEAIARLEQNVPAAQMPEPVSSVPDELAAIAAVIAGAKEALAGPAGGESSTDHNLAFDAFLGSVRTMEKATVDLHDAADRVQELAVRLREAGAPASLCGELQSCATQASTACAFQGLTARRAQIMVEALRSIEERVRPLAGALQGAQPTPARQEATPARDAVPQEPHCPLASAAESRPPEGEQVEITQERSPESSEGPPRPEQLDPPPRALSPSLAAIERLDFRDRLRLFT